MSLPSGKWTILFPRLSAASGPSLQRCEELFLGPLSSVNPNTVATSLSRPDKASATDRPPTFGDRLRTIHPRAWALAIGMAILGWAYWPNFQYLYSISGTLSQTTPTANW